MENDSPTTKPTTNSKVLEDLLDPRRRINSIYKIVDKSGKEIQFQMNWAQEQMYDGMHTRNLVLKCRQIGSTTFWSLYLLDLALFHPNQNVGIISYNLESAHHIFKRVLKHAYYSVPPEYQPALPDIVADSAREMSFSNGSSIRVDTTLRGSALTALLVTEFGRTCARYPTKAQEIVAGSLNALSKNALGVIESTMEGSSGQFFNMCRENMVRKNIVSPLQWKFFFFPWHQDPNYRLKHLPPDNAYPSSLLEYFDALYAQHGIDLDEEQEAWYLQNWHTLGDDVIRQEFPSTVEECFLANSQQYFYMKYLHEIEQLDQITNVPYQSASLVHTAWDLGINDSCSIWFFQQMRSGALHIIDFYEASDEALPHFISILEKKQYTYGKAYLPHDAQSREKTSGESFAGAAKRLGLNVHVLPMEGVLYGINRVRTMLRQCFFDSRRCDVGLNHLKQYRKRWNERMGCYSSDPLHDEHSHAADSMRYLCQAAATVQEADPREKERARRLMELERRMRF